MNTDTASTYWHSYTANIPIPYHLPHNFTTPKDFHGNGGHLSQRQLRKRVRRNGYHTSPNKSRRQQAFKGCGLGRNHKQ